MFDKIIDDITSFATGAGLRLIISVIVLLVGFKLIKTLIKRLKKSKGALAKADPTVNSFIISFLSIALKVVLIITVAAYLGVPMASMITILGSAGVAVGLALQGGLSNIASGLTMLIVRPFAVGDYIKCSNQEGTVASIGIFHTTLTTIDNKRVVIPNGILTSNTLVNYSVEEKRRVEIDFSASYTVDIDKVREVLLNTAATCDKIIKDPAADVVVVEHGDNAVKYRLRAWCKNSDYWDVDFFLMENVKKAFDAAGVEIPFPQMDVHMVGVDKL